MFLDLALKGKLREAVQFVCKRENGGFLKPGEFAADLTGTINENVTSAWRENILAKQFPPVIR